MYSLLFGILISPMLLFSSYKAQGIVGRNFSILSPNLVLAYAENILSDSRLKIVLNANLDDGSL